VTPAKSASGIKLKAPMRRGAWTLGGNFMAVTVLVYGCD
jgi:hypothetical protein